MIIHEDIRHTLHADRDGLKAVELRDLEQHLTGCAECRTYAAALGTFGATLMRAMHTRWDAARPTPDLEQNVRACLGIEQKGFPARILNAALTTAVVIVFALFLRALFDVQSQPATGQSPLATQSASATPFDATIDVTSLSFTPALGTLLDRTVNFSFGASITVNSQSDFIVHIVAFPLLPGETLAECSERSTPADRIFWANQSEFTSGEHTFSQSFIYSDADAPAADRLVARVNVLGPGAIDQLLYCDQHVYQLTSSRSPIATPTPLPTLTASPTPLAATPADNTATFTATPLEFFTPTGSTLTASPTPFPPPPNPSPTPPPPFTETSTPFDPGGLPTPPPAPTFTSTPTPFLATPTATSSMRPDPGSITPFPSPTATGSMPPTATPGPTSEAPTSTATERPAPVP